MAYATVSDVKKYLDVSGDGDDTLIVALIARAQSIIDAHTQRTFEASADTTRTFDALEDVDYNTLYFDQDIVSITTITTNADSSSGGYTIGSSEYSTIPKNDTPYFGVTILHSSSAEWEYDEHIQNGITVTGRWAYSTTAPADIRHACIRLVAFLYRQKDSSADLDRPLLTGDGVTVLPSAMPKDVLTIIAPYVKRVEII